MISKDALQHAIERMETDLHFLRTSIKASFLKIRTSDTETRRRIVSTRRRSPSSPVHRCASSVAHVRAM